MKTNSRTIRLGTGLTVVAGIAITVGAWQPGTPNPGAQKTNTAEAACGCDGQKPGGITPGTPPGTGPGEWCLTQIKYDQRPAPIPEGGIMPKAACAGFGPPDDPAVRDAAIPAPNAPMKTYQIFLNVFREKRGANPAASAAEVAAAMNRLNASYAPYRIQFSYNWRYVDDTTVRYLDDNEVGWMKFKYAVSPQTQLNVFVTTYNPGGSWGTFPWDANAMTVYGGIVLHQPHFADPSNVLIHEVGHCLGLWHTFHGVSEVAQCSDCYEAAGRSAADGDVTGDRCSDTNPGPRNFNCADPPGTDPCSGNAWVDTPIHNFMSYSLDCATELTPQQSGRIYAWTAQSLTGWLAPPPPPAAPGTPELSVSGGTVTISWADNSNDETGFEVQREKKGKGNKWGETATVANVGANVTSTTNAPGSGTFRYRVRAYSGNGASDWTGWAEVSL